MNKSEKCSATQANRIVISRGYAEEKRIYLDELPKYESEGWHRGYSEQHKKNNSESHKGKSNNKGRKLSEDHKKKISNTLNKKLASGEITPAFKGKHHSDKTKETLSQYKGDKNSQYGKPKSKEWKEKTSKSHKEGKKLSNYLKNRTEEQRHTQLSKAWITKKANGTVNTSKPEEELYTLLLEENKSKTIYRNYKCDRYPFYCDFYIVEDDLFIELNAHWTHGGKPFDPNDEECINKLKEWEEKAKTSEYFRVAIETWTVRDVEKQRIAKENGLNYKVIY